jgi:putative transcription factor
MPTERCDVCGREVRNPQLCLIEGAKLKVCPQCAKFGTKIKRESTYKKSKVSSRKSYTRKTGRYSDFEEMVIVDDFPKIIKREREKKGWTQDELGQKLKIKGSIIRKIERGREPTEVVRKQLENLFGINLLTVAPSEADTTYYSTPKSSKGLTLGDVVHLKKKKRDED